MRVTIFCLALFAFVLQLSSQNDLEKRLSQNVINCEDVAQNSSMLFMEYLSTDKYDSAQHVLSFWEQSCDLQEPIQRGKIILAIISGELSEDDYDEDILDYIEDYIERLTVMDTEDSKEKYNESPGRFDFVPFNNGFDYYLYQFAKNVENYDNELEELFSIIYGGEFKVFYTTLQESRFEGTKIRRLYDTEVAERNKLKDNHMSFFIGGFIPTVSDHLFGSHPIFGFSVGIADRKLTYDLLVEFRVGSAGQEYEFVKNDTMTTDFYAGTYIGAQLSYDFLSSKRMGAALQAGLGVDSFSTAFAGDNVVNVYSPNFNAGFLYKWKIKPGKYIGLSYQYNFVFYESDKVLVDLTGNLHSFRLSYGTSSWGQRTVGLNKLFYQGAY